MHTDHDKLWDMGWRIGLIDIHMDDELSVTYDRQFPVQLFALDNETKRAYSWEFTRLPNDTMDWVVSKDYRKSQY